MVWDSAHMSTWSSPQGGYGRADRRDDHWSDTAAIFVGGGADGMNAQVTGHVGGFGVTTARVAAARSPTSAAVPGRRGGPRCDTGRRAPAGHCARVPVIPRRTTPRPWGG